MWQFLFACSTLFLLGVIAFILYEIMEVLRRIETSIDVLTRDWRKAHQEELDRWEERNRRFLNPVKNS